MVCAQAYAGHRASRRLGYALASLALKPELTSVGEFSTTDGLGDGGQLRCSDGTSAPFRFQRLTLIRGYGTGSSSASSLSFTYGLSAEESISYLKVPPGKELRREGNNLELVAAVPFPIR